MVSALLADAVLVLHGLFILWAVLGAIAVAWRPWLMALHLPAAAWAVWISVSGGHCPLTPLEQSLRRAAGQAGYEGGFVAHYIEPLIYPPELTLDAQLVFGAAVLAINLALYAWAAHRVISRRRQEAQSP
jgi:hypothetical protein